MILPVLVAPANVGGSARLPGVSRPRLECLTVGWNIAEGLIALGAGIAAGSIALVGFGVAKGPNAELTAAATPMTIRRPARIHSHGTPPMNGATPIPHLGSVTEIGPFSSP